MSFWNSVSETSSQGYLAWATDLVSSYIPGSVSSFVSDRLDQKESVAFGIVIGTVATVAAYYFFQYKVAPKPDVTLVPNAEKEKSEPNSSTEKKADKKTTPDASGEGSENKKGIIQKFKNKKEEKSSLKKEELKEKSIPSSKQVSSVPKDLPTKNVANPPQQQSVKKTETPLPKKELKRLPKTTNVKVSFCVGMGQELKGECEEKVKKVVNAILTMVQKAEAKVKIGAVGFNQNAFTISDLISISKEEQIESFTSNLVTKVNDSKPGDAVSINAGLDESINQLSKRIILGGSARKVIILLSDTKDDAADVSGIKDKLKKNTTIYTIGFGKNQDGEMLKAIGGEDNYIDTTKRSLEQDIQHVFKTAFSS